MPRYAVVSRERRDQKKWLRFNGYGFAAADELDFFDTEQRGFLLEVRPSGRKTFYQRYTDAKGRTRQC